MTMEIVGNDAQFNGKVTLLKDLEIYGNIKNKTKDTSFDFSDNLSFKIQGNEKLRITADGNIGIGIANPSQKLDVMDGTVVVHPASKTGVALNGIAGQDVGVVRWGGDNHHAIILRGSSSADGTTITGGDSMEFREYGAYSFKTGNNSGTMTERLSIDTTGNVDIATGQLTISNDIKSASDDFFVYSYKGGSDGQVRSGIHFDSTNQRMEFYTATNERLRIASAGQIGIAGANYGSSGQVLTSQGSSSAVQWTSTAAKAYVNFDGTFGTSPFTIVNGGIRAAFNVSSVTDNGTGDYTVTFTNAMANVNYTVTGSTGLAGNGVAWLTLYTHTQGGSPYVLAPTTASFRITTSYQGVSGNLADPTYVQVVVFGD